MPILVGMMKVRRNMAQFREIPLIERRRQLIRVPLQRELKSKGEDDFVTLIPAVVDDGNPQGYSCPLRQVGCLGTGRIPLHAASEIFSILGFEVDPIGRVATDTHLVHHRGNSEHLSVRILRLDVDSPDISIIPLLNGKGVSDDWSMSSRFGFPPGVWKQLGPSLTRQEEGQCQQKADETRTFLVFINDDTSL